MDNKLTISVLVEGSVTFIKVNGELDSYTLKEFKEKIEVILKQVKTINLVFDLNELVYLNSESIGYLFQTFEKLSSIKKSMAIIRAKGLVIDVLQQIGMFNFVPYYATKEEFLKTLKTNE